MKRRSALHGRIWVPFEPSWNRLEPTFGLLEVCLSQLGINLVELDAILDQIHATFGTGSIKNKWNKEALEADSKFLAEQDKIEPTDTSENQTNQ